MNIALEKCQFYRNTLSKNVLFEDLSHESINQLLKISTPDIWPNKTFIVDTNKTLYTFFIIISGKIKVYNYDNKSNRQLTFFILSQKDVFDVCTLINGCCHEVHYEALEKSEVLAIPIYKMKHWIDNNPMMVRRFFKYMIDKMNLLESKVLGANFDDTSTKLAKLLINNIDVKSKKLELINNLPDKELAQFIGTTRSVINRHLQGFKKEGIIELGRKHIRILDMPGLIKKINPINSL